MNKHAAALSGAIEGAEHVFPVRVYYEDTDAAGIVYYANFLKMAERARTEMLRVLGVEHTATARDDGVSFAVRRCEIDYLNPARLDDMLAVHTRILGIGGASLTMEQVIRRAGVDLAWLILRIACVSTTGRATRFPVQLRALLQRFVNQSGATTGTRA